MVCKYCHLSDHSIDNCPTIVCKCCKKIGHALWQCTEKNAPQKKSNNSSASKNVSSTKRNEKPVSGNERLASDKQEKIVSDRNPKSNSKEVSETTEPVFEEKNIAFYLKHEKDCWSEFV